MSISSANSGKKTRFPVRDGALNLAMAVSVSLCINILTAMEWKLNGALGLHLAAFMASLYAGLLVLLYMDVRDESIQAMNQRCAEEEQKNIQAGLDRAEILKKKADITHETVDRLHIKTRPHRAWYCACMVAAVICLIIAAGLKRAGEAKELLTLIERVQQ